MKKLNNLFTEKIGPKLWVLTKPLKFDGITIPEGFVTDGASAPNVAASIAPPMGFAGAAAAVLHDWFYSLDSGKSNISRKEADKIFYETMRSCGVGYFRAKAIYWAVRAGGSFSFKKCYSKEKLEDNQ